MFLWGLGVDDAKGPYTNLLVRYQQGRFDVLPAPGWIYQLRGTSRDNLYAVGMKGLAVRWDGRQWNPVHLSTPYDVMAIDFVNDDELYFATAGGELFAGSRHGATRVLSCKQTFLDVARFGDHVYIVTAGDNGLWRVKAGSDVMEPVKSPYLPFALKRGPDRLLMTCADALIDFDGSDFRVRSVDGVYDVLSDTQPLTLHSPPVLSPPAKQPSQGTDRIE